MTTTAVKITFCDYRAPRKSERTWKPMSKYSIANRGHQRSALVPAAFQCKPKLALTTQYK